MRSKTNTQKGYSNSGLHRLANSCKYSFLKNCVESLDSILQHEHYKNRDTKFHGEEGIYTDKFMSNFAQKNQSDIQSSVDIIIVTCNNYVSLLEAKFDSKQVRNIKHKEIQSKIASTKKLLIDCPYPHDINKYTYILLDDKNYHQNVTRLRRAMSNDTKIRTWRVSDMLQFMQKNERVD